MLLYELVAISLVAVMGYRLAAVPKYKPSGAHFGYRTAYAQANPGSWAIAQKVSAGYGLITNVVLVVLFFSDRQLTPQIAGWLVLLAVSTLFLVTEAAIFLLNLKANHAKASGRTATAKAAPLWIPKKIGFGVQLNPANPLGKKLSKIILIVLLLFLVIVFAVAFYQQFSAR
ncbi:MAG: hypothetical protein LKF36_08855 [Lactobacillus sp.]|jgi:hypothetical protein|nr:hypothetical protein [Lactobacillus sp.]